MKNPHIKQFDNTDLGLLEALTYYKVWASKLSSYDNQGSMWFNINLQFDSEINKFIFTYNSGRK